jgi:hypothetical protein
MIRRLLGSLLLVSCAAVSVLAAVFWFRAAWWGLEIRRTSTQPFRADPSSGYVEHVLVVKVDRLVVIEHYARWVGQPLRTQYEPRSVPASQPYRPFAFSSLSHPSGINWALRLPLWLFMLPAAVPVAWLVDRWRSRRSRMWMLASGRCPACGYDLRASKDRCPECGRPISSA